MNLPPPGVAARLVCTPLGPAGPPGTLLEALASQVDPVLLESTALHEQLGRYSLLACSPLEVLTLRDGMLSDRGGDVVAYGSQAIWGALEDAFSRVSAEPAKEVPYAPGGIGYLGYELARHVEKLPGRALRDTQLADLRLAFYDSLLIYDGLDKTWRLVELEFPAPAPQSAGQAGRLLRKIFASASGQRHEPPPAPAEHASAASRALPAGVESNFTADAYRRAVARCVEYIAAGDIFQVNLSQRLTVHDAPQPLAIYRSLRRRNPSWYGAYMTFSRNGVRQAILSSSPELFLRVRGRQVVTRPIKGTRPRTGEAQADAELARQLLDSPKDNAELAMIVDLLRNDLGRVCRFGSVQVREPRRLETHPTVFHLVATVEGELAEGAGPAQLLRATFPGGSITGAPKIRAMEIIDELEGLARGVYTGCIGIVGCDGTAEWNIAIRTVVQEGSRAMVQVGGGIVADSQPEDEYRETLAKARAILEAIADAAERG